MLEIHQAILVPNMSTNLLCPNQLRQAGIRVNDEPKHLWPNPTDDMHAITIPRNDDPIEGDDGLQIPLDIHGVFSGFDTRKPSVDEYESTPRSRCIELTDQDLYWDPMDQSTFGDEESKMLDSNFKLRENAMQWPSQRLVSTLTSLRPWEIANEDEYFGEALRSCATVTTTQLEDYEKSVRFGGTTKAQVSSVRFGGTTEKHVSAIHTTDRRDKVGAFDLAKKWGIGLEKAKQTITCTTQRGVRSLLHPHLSRRFRTNDRQMRYNRLRHNLFGDTAESKIVSYLRRNKYSQVFATNFGWSCNYPMRRKGDAHEALDLLVQRVGVPNKLIMDGSKEQQFGEFRRKARAMQCRVVQVEPYSPWSNAAEAEIRELKKGAGRKALRYGSPAQLWDHCLELESLVRSHTASDHFECQGQTPETILTGQTVDISPYVEHHWYECGLNFGILDPVSLRLVKSSVDGWVLHLISDLLCARRF
jgi:hypothetical protein